MKIKQKRGISLIVLAITIVVMIILATVVILSLDSSNIIERANEAKEATNLANLKEAASVALAEYKLEVSLGNLDGRTTTANSYVKAKLEEQGMDASTMAVSKDGKVMTGLSKVAAKFVGEGVEIGTSVIGYVLKSDSNSKTVNTNGEENTYDSNNFVETNPQPATGIARDENITWSYAGIDKNGNALIVGNVSSDSPKLILGGKGGYVDGPNTLNSICDIMYSSDMGKARSINMEDITRLLEYAGPVGTYYSADGNEKHLRERKTIGELVAGGEPALTDTSTPDGKDINSYYADYTYISKTSSDIKAGDIGKNLVYQSTMYWLASPCVRADFGNGYANFYVRCVASSYVGAHYVVRSYDDSNGYAYAVRPVVSLVSDIQVTYNGGAATLSK